MSYLLCRKHNPKSKFSKAVTFNIEPCVRYKKNAINNVTGSSYAKCPPKTARALLFHIEDERLAKAADEITVMTLTVAFRLAKGELAMSKFFRLLDVNRKLGLHDFKYFQYRLQGSGREAFLIFGEVIKKKMLERIGQSTYFGLMVDEVTDITVTSQFLSFIWYFDFQVPESGI